MEKYESYSNLFYSLFGIIGYFTLNNVTGIVFFLFMTILSISSFQYHKNKTGKIFLFDWYGMNLTVLGLIGLLLPNIYIYFILIGLNTIYGYLIIGRYNVYKEVGLACLPLIIVLFYVYIWWYVLVILLVFVFALYVRNIDNSHNVRENNYDSIPHSWWHFLTALGFYLCIASLYQKISVYYCII